MPMRCNWLAIALLLGACGQVGSMNGGSPDAGTVTRDAGTVTHDAGAALMTLVGTLDATKAVMFGGPFQGVDYCYYTITLKQLAVSLTTNGAGNVTAGNVQDLNSESTVAPCTASPIPPNIAMYTLQAATPTSEGQTLTFSGMPANVPQATLVATLTRAQDGYTANLTFMRVDNEGPFNWTVTTMVTLAAE